MKMDALLSVRRGASLLFASGALGLAVFAGVGGALAVPTGSSTLTAASAHQPSAAYVARESTVSVDGFTLQLNSGSLNVTEITVTDAGSAPSAVSGVSVYRDNGDNAFGPGDTLLNSTAVAFSGTSAVVTFNSPQAVSTSVQQYWVVYRFSATAANGDTANSKISAVYSSADSLINSTLTGSTFTVDAGPVVAVTTPSDGDQLNNLDGTTISGTALSVSHTVNSVELTIQRTDGKYWDGASWVSKETTLAADLLGSAWEYDWAFSPESQNATPAYTIGARGRDDLGFLGSLVTVTDVTIDNTPPVSAITYPTDDAVLNGTSATISGTATDTGGSGISTVTVSIQRDSDGYFWNGTVWGPDLVSIGAVGTTSWTAHWNFDPSSQDATPTYTIVASATDGNGNEQDSAVVTGVTIDNVNPTVDITSPTTGQTLTGTSKTISGTATDTVGGVPGSGVTGVQVAISRSSDGYFWNGSAWVSAVTPQWLSATGTSSWTYSWTFSPASQHGTPLYVIRARSTDAGGSHSDTATVTGVSVSNTTYTLAYTAGIGGSIEGSATQVVAYGESGTSVTASASAGFRFVKWSDESTANPRTDTNVTANKSVSASFASDWTVVYRFRKTGTVGNYLWSASPAEIANIMSSGAFVSEGAAFRVNTKNPVNVSDVTRFKFPTAWSYFYTANPGEKQAVINSRTWNLEGAAWQGSLVPGDEPAVRTVWRFRCLLRPSQPTYFWTWDRGEMERMVAGAKATYTLEGVAYYIGQ